MKNYLGRVILLVDDYEKASQFYEENFDFVQIKQNSMAVVFLYMLLAAIVPFFLINTFFLINRYIIEYV